MTVRPEDLAATYDDWYSTPEAAHWEHAPGKRVLIEAISRLFDARSAPRVLDIGCGTGSFLARIRSAVLPRASCHGIDVSAVAVREGLASESGLRLLAGDATTLPYPDCHFQLVLCYGSWEHFADPAKAIAEAIRVTAPGGWILAMIPALGEHRTDRDDEGWYEDTPVAGSDRLQLQWNLYRRTWEKMFNDHGAWLASDRLAGECGAIKTGVFFFATRPRLHDSSTAAAALLDLGYVAASSASQSAAVERAGAEMGQRLRGGAKVLACGNGGSAADAQHFVAELVGRFGPHPRPALGAVSLSSDPSIVSAIANDFGYQLVFARQVEALGRPGDVLLAITTSGRSENVLEAMTRARDLGLFVVALSSEGAPAAFDTLCDVCIRVPSTDTQKIQEVHGALLHVLCATIEMQVRA